MNWPFWMPLGEETSDMSRLHAENPLAFRTLHHSPLVGLRDYSCLAGLGGPDDAAIGRISGSG